MKANPIRHIVIRGRACDCPVMAYHHELCWTTPIFAAMARACSPREIINDIGMELFQMSCQQTNLAEAGSWHR